MRSIILAALVVVFAAVLFAVAGCGDDTTHDVIPDLATAALPACPPGADVVRGATCQYGVDTLCEYSHGPPCRCLCDGYWECDLVKRICDGGTAHD